MRPQPFLRLEWIWFVYLALFVLAVLSPSLVTHDFIGIDERHVEELLIFVFGVTGLITFSIYQRIMERDQEQHEHAKNDYERAKRELVESYQYIGSINRKIELLKRITNQTSLKIVESDRSTKDIFHSLLANARARVNAETACIRYVDLEKMRTEHEIHSVPDAPFAFKIGNKELKKVHENKLSHAFIRSDDGQDLLVVPSDHQLKRVKAYLLFPVNAAHIEDIDMSLLKVFANQAELLHFAFKEQSLLPEEAVKTDSESQGGVGPVVKT
jgi:hypothetical protein